MTREGKYNMVKVQKFADKATKSLNKQEVVMLVDDLVEYLEGNVCSKTIKRIEQSVNMCRGIND